MSEILLRRLRVVLKQMTSDLSYELWRSSTPYQHLRRVLSKWLLGSWCWMQMVTSSVVSCTLDSHIWQPTLDSHIWQPPWGQLALAELHMVVDDSSLDKTLPSLAEVREAVRKLKARMAIWIFNTSAEMFEAGCEAMILGLSTIWQTGNIFPDRRRKLVVPIWKIKGDWQDCNSYGGITLPSVLGWVFGHLLLMWNLISLAKASNTEAVLIHVQQVNNWRVPSSVSLLKVGVNLNKDYWTLCWS